MSKTILIADDEETIRSIVGQVLDEEGYEVREASTGEEALALFRKGSYDLVLTDMVMGCMTGLELVREIRDLDPEARVVVMSGDVGADTTQRALAEGACDYLSKPFPSIGAILELVERQVGRARP